MRMFWAIWSAQRSLLQSEKDPEFIEMAKMELAELEQRKEQLEESLTRVDVAYGARGCEERGAGDKRRHRRR
jgi:hypothetical protein